jgi:hypothetical protein
VQEVWPHDLSEYVVVQQPEVRREQAEAETCCAGDGARPLMPKGMLIRVCVTMGVGLLAALVAVVWASLALILGWPKDDRVFLVLGVEFLAVAALAVQVLLDVWKEGR